ncbi:response regulator transcription factor [Nocardioides pantholopis]|uniref:response regulator transcription factor n=1 Tax=Nocardioides pantholopis TaxID=2483798 RepID=UPI000F092A87|nr:response regulator transcription factor [Nocardioides pantholopis]
MQGPRRTEAPPDLTDADRRVVVIEDHVLLAESLTGQLRTAGWEARLLPVPDTVPALGEVVDRVARLQPRVAVLDIDGQRFGDGLRLVAPLVRSGVGVVALTTAEERTRRGEALGYGAGTVLTGETPLADLLAAVRAVAVGQPAVDPEERHELVAAWRLRHRERRELLTRFANLTGREREVLSGLLRGRAVRQISSDIGVTEATVRTHVKSILAKLRVGSQLAAVGLAHRIGWRHRGS